MNTHDTRAHAQGTTVASAVVVMEARARYSLHLLRILLAACVSLCVTSLAHAQSVTLAWDANTEPNLTGYVVLYGTSSGIYPYSQDVGNVTTKQITANPDREYALLFRGEGIRQRVENEFRVERSLGRDGRRHEPAASAATPTTPTTAADGAGADVVDSVADERTGRRAGRW